MNETMQLTFTVNGATTSLETKPGRRALDVLRDDLGLLAAKEGCGSGECGACAVGIDGEVRLSCLMLAAQLDGLALKDVGDGGAIAGAFNNANSLGQQQGQYNYQNRQNDLRNITSGLAGVGKGFGNWWNGGGGDGYPAGDG